MIKRFLFRTAAVSATIIFVLTAWLLWGPTGTLIVTPLVRLYGERNIPALKIGGVSGTLFSGYSLHAAEVVSGDTRYLKAGRVTARLSWPDLLHGIPWLSELEITGLDAEVSKLEALAAHYSDPNSSSSMELRPLRVRLTDVTLATPQQSFHIDGAVLTRKGRIALSADLNGMPLGAQGQISFSPLELLSADLLAGSGRISLGGRLSAPFDIKGTIDGVKLEELLDAAGQKLTGSGAVGGRFSVQGTADDLKAWGSLSLQRGNITGVPLEADVPWSYKNGKLMLADSKIRSLEADIKLKAFADLNAKGASDLFVVRGEVKNVSMKKVERALHLKTPLSGENGMLDFRVSGDAGGRMAGKLFVRLPELLADGKRIVKGLRAVLLMTPTQDVTLDCTGELFGGKLLGSGSVMRNSGPRPTLSFSARGVNAALIGSTFPELGSLGLKGQLNLEAHVGGDMAVVSDLRSARLAISGTNLDNLSLATTIDSGRVTVNGLKATIGKAPLSLAGTADLRTQALNFNGKIMGLNPNAIPSLGSSVTGPCDVSLSVGGYMSSPRVTASVAGSSNKLGGVEVRRLRLNGTYADNKLTIPETTLLLPVGSVSFRGEVGLPKYGEPSLNIAGSLNNLDLKSFSAQAGRQLTGRLEGNIKISGPASKASVSALLRSPKITVDKSEISDLVLDCSGTTKDVTVRSIRANVNGGSLDGSGHMSFASGGKMKVDMKVKGVEMRRLFSDLGVNSGIGGYMNGTLSLHGTTARPELSLRVNSPLTIQEMLVDHLALTLQSPGKDRFELNASGTVGELQLNLKGHMRREREAWVYSGETGDIDLNKLVTAKSPSMKGQLSGAVRVKASGFIPLKAGQKASPVDVAVTLPSISAGGATVTDIVLPLRVQGNNVTVRKGSGLAYGGKISINADVNMPNQQWTGTVKVAGLDIGKAAAQFMKEGEIVGSADVNVKLKGDYGALMMVFANGDFKTRGSGYIHKMKVLNKVAEKGRLSWQDLRGTFFWNGRDLWLNPGTQATALPRDPLYKTFTVNGPLGVSGKGLDLNCRGRFNIKSLETLLGAAKGAFQLMTGSLSGGGQFVRQGVAKMIGYDERDFQDVSFQLKGSWQNLQMLNLKIDKPLETYIPLKKFMDEEESRKESEQKFQINIKIPTGSGGGTDSEDMNDQFKKQFLDNLMNQFNF